MALQTVGGSGLWVPKMLLAGAISPSFTSFLLDASADRIVYAGRFFHRDHVAKTVNGAGFLLGAVTKSNGSTLQCSLQDVNLTTGPPLREDGTPDQTLTIANADAGFASNLWYEGGFDAEATRTLTPGDLVAVVLQFGTFVAGDSVNIRTIAGGLLVNQQGGVVTNLSGTYATQNNFPNVVFRCSDGTYGTIEDSWPCVVAGQIPVASTTAGADEYALSMQFPFPCKADGLWAFFNPVTATDQTEFLLYSGTTPLVTLTVDHNATLQGIGRPILLPFPSEITLSANTLYRLAIRPLGTNTISIYYFDVQTAAHLQCHGGDPVNSHVWTRVDQGAWGDEVTTRRLFAGVRLSAFDDGVSAGGGLLVHPGLSGGMRG